MQHSRSAASLIAVSLAAAVLNGCGGPNDPAPPVAANVVFVGAGDIAICGSAGADATARLLDRIPGTVFTTGDNAYPVGSPANYRDCYDPTWGRHKERTRPVPGNHEYDIAGAAGYFGYFGPRVGMPVRSYYAYTLGSWKALALDSNVDVSAASPQLQFVRAELAGSPMCTVAYWHHPLYSSGPHGNDVRMREMWAALYDAGADLILNGHDHLYERFAPQNSVGQIDMARGVRQFTVGTGGAELSGVLARRFNSERVISESGVLKLTLEAAAFSWEFIGLDGGVRDTGRAPCH